MSCRLFAFILFTIFASRVADAAGSSKCYSSLPLSYGSGSTYIYQSSGHCSGQCSGYAYYALHNGNTCLCSNDAPDSGDEVDSDQCDTKCSGYGEESCGGSSAYQVFTLGSASSSATASSGLSSTGSSGASSTSSGSSGSASNTGSATTKSGTITGSDSTYVQIITQIATLAGGSTHIRTVTASRTDVATSVVSDTAKDSGSNSKAKLIGPIVGGVIGGLAALSILALVIFFIRRQRQKDRDLLDADANIIATMKRNEGSSHTRQLSNPFADDFVDPPARNNDFYGVPSDNTYVNSQSHTHLGDDGTHDYYETNANTGRPKLAVVNPDKE